MAKEEKAQIGKQPSGQLLFKGPRGVLSISAKLDAPEAVLREAYNQRSVQPSMEVPNFKKKGS